MDKSNRDKVLALRNEGKSYNEISKQTGLSKATISYYCKAEGLGRGLLSNNFDNPLLLKQLRDFLSNHTQAEAAVNFDVSVSTIKRYVSEKCKVLSPQERIEYNYKHVKSFRQKSKEKAVAYKGGKCERCGYDKCVRAFDFHHIDPSEKDFSIGQNSNKAWDKIKQELDKCQLLCANCHREVHHELDNC